MGCRVPIFLVLHTLEDLVHLQDIFLIPDWFDAAKDKAMAEWLSFEIPGIVAALGELLTVWSPWWDDLPYF